MVAWVQSRDREIALLLSAANSKRVLGIVHCKGDVRGALGSEKHEMNFYVFIWRKAFSSYMST